MARGKENLDYYLSKIKDVVTHPAFVILLLIIPMLLAGYYRAYPATLPITEDWAANNIQQQSITQIENQLRQEYPLLPANQIRAQANQQYQQFLNENADQYEQTKQQLAEQFRSQLQFQPEGYEYEQTYLLAIDPYYYLRRAENIQETGVPCDAIVEGECRDEFMLAPVGVRANKDWHSYVEAGIMSTATVFGLAPVTGAFYLPLIFAVLAVIPAFFIVKKKENAFAGLIAGSIVALHGAFLGRTPAGFADTDVWNVFFPIYIAWIFFEAVRVKQLKRRIILMALAGVLIGIYSKFWGGWVFTYFLLLPIIIGLALYSLAKYLIQKYQVKNKKIAKTNLKRAKESGILAGTLFLSTSLLIGIIHGIREPFNSLLTPFKLSTGLQDPATASLWPNVLTTVAELNVQGIGSILNSIGVKSLVVFSILGIFAFYFKTRSMNTKRWVVLAGVLVWYTTLINNPGIGNYLWLALFTLPIVALLIYTLWDKEEYDIIYPIFTGVWYVATIFATTQGVRFLFLIVPVLAITVGLASGWLMRMLGWMSEQYLELNKFWGIATAIILITCFMTLPLGGASPNMLERAHNVALNERPAMNDAWWESLEYIKENSEEDAIITSWWDFGHWFKYVAERPVTFDGASQTTPQAHWVGKLLSTSDLQESAAILRMLNCGANNAYDTIYEELNDNLRTYKLLDSIIGIGEEQARQTLNEEGLSQSAVDAVIDATYCEPPESFLITSGDMVSKAGVWSHFGLWDFERSFAYNAYRSLPRQEAINAIAENLDVDLVQAGQTYQTIASLGGPQQINSWISPWPSFAGGGNCQSEGEILNCNLNMRIGVQQGVPLILQDIIINTTNTTQTVGRIFGNGQQIGTATPTKVVIDGEETNLPGDLDFTISIVENQAIIGQDPLPESTFAQLFYLEEGGEIFEQVTSSTDVAGTKILVYKVNWDEV